MGRRERQTKKSPRTEGQAKDQPKCETEEIRVVQYKKEGKIVVLR
jgi:hypothetical protein